MCGIAGTLEFGGRSRGLQPGLDRMVRALAHRGPDERGLWTDGAVGLGAQRLRIVDLETGQQPMSDEDGRLRLVANGEIYNANELRATLTARGHVFASRTDTEVILHGYEEFGTAILDRLEGMFAFALWDGVHSRLILARDRFGEKPLYYARLEHGFLFASELKALLAHPHVSRELDWRSVAKYLAYDYVPSPASIFRSARKLLPAHYMEIDASGREVTWRYWSPPAPVVSPLTLDEAADEIGRLLRASVARRVQCDVPWGCFLSGGLDSSLVTALAAEHAPGPMQTFAIGFDEPTYDERLHAARAARTFGTEHHETILRGADVTALLSEVARVFDEPFADPSSLPAVLLSRLARRYVTVALSGDGADELFCGYPTQTAHWAAELFMWLPAALRRRLAGLGDLLPTSHTYLSFDFALRRFLHDVECPPAERHLRWMSGVSPEQQQRLFAPAVAREVRHTATYEDADRVLAEWRPGTVSDVATALDFVLYLAEDNLVQADRASMASALEVRAPFLDRGLAEYALALPSRLRRGVWQTKPLLRRAAQSILPGAIVRRGKHGFGVPTGAWLRGPLRGLARDLLEPGRLRRQGIFEPGFVNVLLRRHLEGTANHRKELWSLLMFQLWSEAYCGA